MNIEDVKYYYLPGGMSIADTEKSITYTDGQKEYQELIASGVKIHPDIGRPQYSKSQTIKILIDKTRNSARTELSETDWYIIRKQETGKEIPQDILNLRSKIREKCDIKIRELESL